MSKQEELEKIKQSILEADLPLKKGATNMVFGEGNIDSKIVFIGEAPGFHEDQQGRPFVGRAGILLEKLLLKAGLKREEVYITNLVRYRPPENRDPEPSEIEKFVPYLIRQIETLDPKVIVTLGRFSMNIYLPKVKISQVHGRVHRVGGRIVVPMFHPAAALRSTGVMKEITEDFERLPAILESPSEENLQKKDDNDPQMGLF